MRRGLVAGLLVTLAVIAGLLAYGRWGDRCSRTVRPAGADARGGPAASPGPGSRAAAPPPATRPAARERLTGEAREHLLAALARARDARAPTPGGARPPVPGAAGGTMPVLRADGGPLGVLDKEYIRASIRELVPLVKECYVNALADRPDLGGKVTVEFEIAGEPELGGVVTTSRIVGADAGPLHAGLEECVRETMYGLKLDAPAGGGIVTVRYPFVFRAQ